jgi:hypothetical protein
MQEFILISIPLLLVLYLSYGRLRGRIKSLEEQINTQRLFHAKLHEANRDLKAELIRIEARLDASYPSYQPVKTQESEVEPEVEPVPSYRVVSEEPATPPPLPAFLTELCDKMADEAQEVKPDPPQWMDAAPSNIPVEQGPSFASSIPWRDILKRMHLLPPEKSDAGGTAESQLAAWWVIRIGLVLLIIAAVFFGIHVSQHTPPWLRVLTLCLVSLGTISLGSRMKERLEGFGRAIIGGGFALLYFTAFAAFALPATRIIESPTIGVLAQFSALVAAILWSLWKRDQTVATLTLFLGLVSCAFSHSHDLDRFATVGLALLAATASFLFAKRGWVVPFITALIGSWLGFGAFALLDKLRGDPPELLQLMAALLALTSLFEAGNLVCAARGLHAIGDRLRRWLMLGNTSAAAIIGYGVTRLTHAEQLPEFYFTTAVLFFIFTVIHHLRTADRVVTESLFLKSSALLCLGFAAAFSGPVRWLSIAFQAFALLWTSRRSGSRWIAAGFAVVMAASLGWFWRDVLLDPPALWRWTDPFRIAGSLFLVFLTVQLALHSRWFPDGIGGGEEHRSQARAFRVAGVLVIGFTVLALAHIPSRHGQGDPIWFLLALPVMMALVSPLTRSGIPCMAAVQPLGCGFIAYALLPSKAGGDITMILLGGTLVLTAFGVSEAIRRFWPQELAGGNVAHEASLLAGLATLLPISRLALAGMFPDAEHAGPGLFALFPAVACAALLHRRQAAAGGSFYFQAAVGMLVLTGGFKVCAGSDCLPAALALAGLPMLAVAACFRIRNIVIAGAIPILGSFVALWRNLQDTQPGGITGDAINLAVLLMVSSGLAIIHWKKIPHGLLRNSAPWVDALLHVLGVVSLHLFFQKYLGEGPDFLAAALLGALLYMISLRFPFYVLGIVSWLPVALACVVGILAGNHQGVADAEIPFATAGLLVLGQIVAFTQLCRRSPQPLAAVLEFAISGIAVLAWTLIALATAKTPWHAAVLTGVALICSALWRWRSIPRIGHLGMGPMTLAFCMAVSLLLTQHFSPSPVAPTLLAILLTSAEIALNGMIMASGVRRVSGLKITAASVLPWVHSLGALSLAFAAFTSDRLVNEKLTAVFWGITAILLFVCGLFAGLRAYRLTGLLGLVFCTGHIFIYDIQNTFHRIIAFFVIGLVMLAVGFLYHRFRERISAFDE